MDPNAIRDLRNRRFPELPLDCGERLNPGVSDHTDWRDWSEYDTTRDQLRIEDFIDLFDLAGNSILHIGVGNSGLTSRFASRAASIFGTTVVEAEVVRANALGFPNYRAIVHNKYSGDVETVPHGFDFIVDNNPTTFCCCMTHLGSMLDFYSRHLLPGGQVVTDRVGLRWTTAASNPRWSFGFDDLASVSSLAGLSAYSAGPWLILLSKGKPRRPALLPRTRHQVRSTVRYAFDAARAAVRRVR